MDRRPDRTRRFAFIGLLRFTGLSAIPLPWERWTRLSGDAAVRRQVDQGANEEPVLVDRTAERNAFSELFAQLRRRHVRFVRPQRRYQRPGLDDGREDQPTTSAVCSIAR